MTRPSLLRSACFGVPLLVALGGCDALSPGAVVPGAVAPSWIDDYLAGSRDLERGDLVAARRAFEAALGTQPSNTASAYQLACVEARSTNVDAALAALERARSLGFDDAALANWDADLQMLRGNPRFDSLVASLTPAAGDPSPVPRAVPITSEYPFIVEPGDRSLLVGVNGKAIARCAIDGTGTALLFGRTGQGVWNFALNPDGKSLVALIGVMNSNGRNYGSGFLAILDAQTGAVRKELPIPSPHGGLEFAADGSRFATRGIGEGKTTVFDATTLATVAELPDGANAIELTKDGSRAVLTYRDMWGPARTDVMLYDVDRHAVIARHDHVSDQELGPIVLTPDGARAAIGDSVGHRILVVDLSDGSLGANLELGDLKLGGLVAVSNSELLAFGVGGTAVRLPLDGQGTRATSTLPDGAEGALDVSCDRSLALVSKSYSNPSVIDLATGAVLWSAPHRAGVTISDGRFTADESGVVFSLCEHSLGDVGFELRDARTGALTGRIENPFVNATVAMNVDDTTGLLAVPDGPARLLDLASGRTRADDRTLGPRIQAAPFPDALRNDPMRTTSADGRTSAGAFGRRVRIVSAEPGSTPRDVTVEGTVRQLQFEPSGRRLWVGDDRAQVHVLALDGSLLGVLDHRKLDPFEWKPIETLSFSPDGALAVTATSGCSFVAAWDANTFERRWTYSYDGGTEAPVQVCFGRGGRRVYVHGPTQWTTRIVDAATGTMILDLAGREIWALRPTPDERCVLAETSRGLECIDADSGAVLWSRIDLTGGDWILTASDGHIDGTPGGIRRTSAMGADGAALLVDIAPFVLDVKKVAAAAARVAVTPPQNNK